MSCPVCFREYSIRNDVLQTGPPTCNDRICNDCWESHYLDGGRDCPICKMDISGWIGKYKDYDKILTPEEDVEFRIYLATVMNKLDVCEKRVRSYLPTPIWIHPSCHPTR